VSSDVGASHARVGTGPRRLDPALDAAILQAVLAGLAEHGYDRLSMDDIAARAHVGKAAIYRRWPSKAAVVAGAILWWREQVATVAAPDTGSLRGDAEAVIAAVPDFDDADRGIIGVILGVATAAAHDPGLATALEEHALARPREALAAILARAADRGEIPPGRDLTLVPDVLLGLNLLRLVTGRPIDRAFVRHVVEDVILPLVTAPLPGPSPTGRGKLGRR
jgi:AcrR family transcriptional regulator